MQKEFSSEAQNGIPKGRQDDVRKEWDKQSCRIPTRKETRALPAGAALIKALPAKLLPLLHKSMTTAASLPKLWAPSNEHWIDVRRFVGWRVGGLVGA